jgi:hypothetical protein
MIMSAATGKVVARIRRPERYFLIDTEHVGSGFEPGR